MKRLITLVASILFIAATATQVHAAFGSVSKSTVTAAASPTGAGQVLVSLQLRTIDTGTGLLGAATTQLHWGVGGTAVTLPNQWQIARAAIVMHSTITNIAGGIQIYTDNKAADASPQYVGISSSALGAMLDTFDAPDGVTQAEQSASRAALCWRPVDVSTNSLTIIQVDGDGNPLTPDDALYSQEIGPFVDPETGNLFGQWFFMLDKARLNEGTLGNIDVPPTDANGAPFVTVKDAGGVHLFPGPDDFAPGMPSPDTIYVGANFGQTFAGRSYKATIRLEAFTE